MTDQKRIKNEDDEQKDLSVEFSDDTFSDCSGYSKGSNASGSRS